jgi:hypothetical protein
MRRRVPAVWQKYRPYRERPGVGDYVRFLGQALYRNGQYEAAVRHFDQLVKTKPLWGDDQLFLAMAQHQMNNVGGARDSLARATAWIDGLERTHAEGDYWAWFDRVRVRRLHKEARALIEP